MFLSKRTPEFKFQVKDLITKAIPSIYVNKGLISSKVMRPPASAIKPFKNPEVAPENGYT